MANLLDGFEVATPKPKAWYLTRTMTSYPRVTLKMKLDANGKPKHTLALSAGALTLVDWVKGETQVQFLTAGSVVAIQAVKSGGHRINKASYISIVRVIGNLPMALGSYPVHSENGILFFDRDDIGTEISTVDLDFESDEAEVADETWVGVAPDFASEL
ncbi:MAG: hypothetical protein WCP21_17980 [Armatimonadota bacterium]